MAGADLSPRPPCATGSFTVSIFDETIMPTRGNRVATKASYWSASSSRDVGKPRVGGEEMKIRRDWTPREDAILQQGALTGQTVGEIARMVGRTMSAVLTRARNRQIRLLRRSTSKSLSAPGLMA
jgi:hypothetical protein